MNPPSKRSDSTVDTSRAKRVLWMPVNQSEVDRDPRKSRTRRRAVLVLALLGLALIRLAFWGYSAFDPARWAYKGYYHAVVAIVRIDPEIVNRPIDGGWTLLYAASYGDHPEIVKFLLESGADQNLATGGRPCGSTPVDAAASGGSAESLKLLIKAGADFDGRKNCNFEVPLLEAARQGHVEVVKVLVDAGIDPNTGKRHNDSQTSEPQGGFRALEWAAISGHADVVKLLVERGASVKFSDNGRLDTALHTFCCYLPLPQLRDGSYEHWLRAMPTIVDLFVEQLVDVNYRDGRGDTPLHEAASTVTASNVDLVRYLVENYPDLDVNAKNTSGQTPLHKAMVGDSKLPLVKYLVENCPNLDVNAVDQFKQTPLHWGAKFKSVGKVKYLLQNCPSLDVKATNEWGESAYRIAQRELADAKGENQQRAINAIIDLLTMHGGHLSKRTK